MDNIKIVNLIKLTKTIGDGTKENPVRKIIQYWSLKGKLLFTIDNYELTNSSASSDVNS